MRHFFFGKKEKTKKETLPFFFVKVKIIERKRTQNCSQKPSFIDDKNNCEM
jgi:hypothetical protein